MESATADIDRKDMFFYQVSDEEEFKKIVYACYF